MSIWLTLQKLFFRSRLSEAYSHWILQPFSCYTKLYASSLIWRQWNMDSNILQMILTITFYLKTQKVCHSWEWKPGDLRCFTHRINFPLTVLEIWWQNLTANRTGFYKTVFWIQSPIFWESEKHSQFQLSCKMVLNSDCAVMIFFQNHFGKLMFKEHFFSDEWTILLLLAADLLSA